MNWPVLSNSLLGFAVFVVIFQDVLSQGCNQNTCGACVADPGCTWCLQGNGIADPNNPGNCTSLGNANTCAALVNMNEDESDSCNGEGVFTCHGCQCNAGFIGSRCDCNLDHASNEYCKPRGDSAVCSGRGACVCGMCDCNPILSRRPNVRYSGQYCECDDHSCDYFDGALCGAPDRGECSCGVCVCKPGYEGTACECPTSQESCIDERGTICGGHGRCICGRCQCDDLFYRGYFCLDCPTCKGRCERLKDCVQCSVFNSGSMDEETCSESCPNLYTVEYIDGNDPSLSMCQFRDEDDCRVIFAYQSTGTKVFVQETIECGPLPEPTIGAANCLDRNPFLHCLWILAAYIMS